MSDNKKELYKLYKSTNPKKKWDIYVINPKTNRRKKISFGSSSYQDYTQHHDKDRRERYRARHKKDKIDDITKPGSFSYFVLWGESTDIDKNLNDMLKRFNIKK